MEQLEFAKLCFHKALMLFIMSETEVNSALYESFQIPKVFISSYGKAPKSTC